MPACRHRVLRDPGFVPTRCHCPCLAHHRRAPRGPRSARTLQQAPLSLRAKPHVAPTAWRPRPVTVPPSPERLPASGLGPRARAVPRSGTFWRIRSHPRLRSHRTHHGGLLDGPPCRAARPVACVCPTSSATEGVSDLKSGRATKAHGQPSGSGEHKPRPRGSGLFLAPCSHLFYPYNGPSVLWDSLAPRVYPGAAAAGPPTGTGVSTETREGRERPWGPGAVRRGVERGRCLRKPGRSACGRGLPLCSLPAISFFKQNKSIYVLWKTTLPKLSLAAHSAVTLLGSAPEGVGTPGAAWQFSGRVIPSPGLR